MRRNELSQNLTFEEFKALAEREPSLKGRWIYMHVKAGARQSKSERKLFVKYQPIKNCHVL